jgi:hypothetical protein
MGLTVPLIYVSIWVIVLTSESHVHGAKERPLGAAVAHIVVQVHGPHHGAAQALDAHQSLTYMYLFTNCNSSSLTGGRGGGVKHALKPVH